MNLIGPALTREQLKQSVEQTLRGDGLVAGLPGIQADAKRMDPKAYEENRELAKRISEALAATKQSDGTTPRFVLGWRLYPNQESAFWQRADGTHVCGCGCGCCSPPSEGNV